MTTIRDAPIEFMMTLTEEERTQLLSWLKQRLKDKLVEEHRTERAAYREYVLHEEALLEKLIAKLRRD